MVIKLLKEDFGVKEKSKNKEIEGEEQCCGEKKNGTEWGGVSQVGKH